MCPRSRVIDDEAEVDLDDVLSQQDPVEGDYLEQTPLPPPCQCIGVRNGAQCTNDARPDRQGVEDFLCSTCRSNLKKAEERAQVREVNRATWRLEALERKQRLQERLAANRNAIRAREQAIARANTQQRVQARARAATVAPRPGSRPRSAVPTPEALRRVADEMAARRMQRWVESAPTPPKEPPMESAPSMSVDSGRGASEEDAALEEVARQELADEALVRSMAGLGN